MTKQNENFEIILETIAEPAILFQYSQEKIIQANASAIKKYDKLVTPDSTILFPNGIVHHHPKQPYYRSGLFPLQLCPTVQNNQNNLFYITILNDQYAILIDKSTKLFTNDSIDERISKFERLALVGRFAGGITHDFKNMITGIQSMLEWCIQEANPDSIIHDALQETFDYTKQARELIASLLGFIGGKDDKNMQSVFLDQLIITMEPLLSHVISSAITLELDVEENLPPIWAQALTLQDMILNICLNACDAMKEQGSILKLQVYKEQTEKNKEQIVISIQDNGCGMNQKQVDSIFDAFYSTKENGVGLGMWMVKNTTKKYNGKIVINSKPKEGTIFKISFPVLTENKKQLPNQSKTKKTKKQYDKPPTNQKEITVLLIDDEPLVRSGISRQLRSAGYNVLMAADGNEGLNIFKQNIDNIELILQDFILPGIRGDQLLQKFKEQKPELPVIVISAYPDKDTFASIKEKGAYDILPKPFEMHELLNIIQKAIIESNN